MRSDILRLPARPACMLVLVASLLACLHSPASAEPSLGKQTESLRSLVARLADKPVGDVDAQKEMKAAFLQFDSTYAREWLLKNESAAVVYATSRPVTPAWGPVHEYASAWNDMLTLARHHGAAPAKERPLVQERRPGFWNLTAAFPVTPRWNIEWPKEDQKSAILTQKNFAGKVIRTITFYVYKWNTVYSGVGGENAQKLAEVLWKLDREIYAEKAKDASRSVETKAFNKSIPRSYYYFARGPDPTDEREKRTRNWYFKGRTHTFCVEVEEELDPSFATTEVDRALVADDDPEIALVLGSIVITEV